MCCILYSAMLHKNFQERPTASELLAMPLFACTQFYQILPEILHHHHHRQHHTNISVVVPSSSPPIVRKHTPSTRTSGSSLPDSNSGFQSPVYAHGTNIGITKSSPPSISTRTISAPDIISSDIHSSHHTTKGVVDLGLGIEPYPVYQHHHRHSVDSVDVYV